MRLFTSQWLSLRAGVCLVVALLFVAPVRADDPVDDLRRALTVSGTTDDGAAEGLAFRRDKLKDSIDRMKTIGQLRRALVLDEWKVDPDRVVNDGIRGVDTEMRKLVGERLKKALERMAQQGDGNARLAVANLIAEMGPTVRGIDPADSSGYARTLVPLVTQMTQDRELGVRQEALRALGNINGPPKEVTDVFRGILKNDAEVGPRRLAADGLQQLVKVTMHLQKRGQTSTGVKANRKDLLDVLQSVTSSAAAGMSDSDSEVRMLSLNAVQAAAQALAELLEIPEGSARRNFPPPGRRLTPNERTRIMEAYAQAQESLAQVKPLLDTFRNDTPIFAKGLSDPEARVRLAACQAFENLGNARLRLVRRALSLPTLRDGKDAIEKSPNELLKQADFLLPFLETDLPQVQVLLRDPDVRIRRSASEILEVLEDKALPCLGGLIAALQDNDRFVRWTAAKTIGSLPADKVGTAVMPLAGLLSDQDLNLRIAAAASLEALGPMAKDAVPALAQSVRAGDIEARLAAMYALISIGSSPARQAVPALIEALGSSDPRVLKAACEVLAAIGQPAAEALPTLRRLLGNEDAEVRAGASEAILSILRLPE